MPKYTRNGTAINGHAPAGYSAKSSGEESNGVARFGTDSVFGFPPREKTETEFPAPVKCSELTRRSDDRRWLLQGCLAPGEVTLFSALWKAGKTTWLAHLLKAFGEGGLFCGLEVAKARVLYVTEEDQHRWADRRDALGLGDHVDFIARPFLTKPSPAKWVQFIEHLAGLQSGKTAHDVVFLDTISNLWPVSDENNPTEVNAALMPLHALTPTAAVTLVHHFRKSGGGEATGFRGSGALGAFPDTILEMRRHDANSRHDRRRVLTGYGRSDETPGELVLELTEDGYVSSGGDRQELASIALKSAVLAVLTRKPGSTYEEICALWPVAVRKPTKARILDELNRGDAAGDWKREGEGKKGSPYKYYPA